MLVIVLFKFHSELFTRKISNGDWKLCQISYTGMSQGSVLGHVFYLTCIFQIHIKPSHLETSPHLQMIIAWQTISIQRTDILIASHRIIMGTPVFSYLIR